MPAWLYPRTLLWEDKEGSHENPGVETARSRTEGLAHSFCFSFFIQAIPLPLQNSSL